jgi:hypothetical protein
VQKLDDLKYIDRHIANSLELSNIDPYHIPKAILFGIETFNGEPPLTVAICGEDDVYDMLENEENAKQLAPYTKFGVVCCGWAAPLPTDGTEYDESVRPSEHTGRRRVRLFTMYYDGDVLSSIRFSDDDDNPIYDSAGDASGSLQDAIVNMYAHSRFFKKIEGIND